MSLDVRHKSYKKAMVCPFYKKDTPNCIFCTSFLEQSSLVLTFGDRGDKKEYQRRYCAGAWEKCRRAKTLSEDGTV